MERGEDYRRSIVGITGEVVDWGSGMPLGQLGERGRGNAVGYIDGNFEGIWLSYKDTSTAMGDIAKTGEGDVGAWVQELGAIDEIIGHYYEEKVDG